MFSGIIEKTTHLIGLEESGTNKIFSFENVYPEDIYIDQSISHNGVCLTVIEFDDKIYKAEAIQETLALTNLDSAKPGDLINLERSMMAHSRMDGHMVQGHVDGVAEVKKISEMDGSWIVQLEIPADKVNLVIQKGSIALNGISLTLKSVHERMVEVAIIPYTYQMTNIHQWKLGDYINVEYDIMGKYIIAYMEKINAR